MSNEPAIKVSNIAKSYIISHQSKSNYHTVKDDLTNFLKKPIGGGSGREKHETFWALKDVSFEVNQGEIFGIVGRNGSGKSTLLKILSRIVDPTHGEVRMRGRVASLLEVGTGFHPELTGRENIYFNGSMLGMSRQEIKQKFDEIVDFSEVGKFLDTPVKFYSSGMYVRLAFSVAAHLDSEILILDEVLSVGDAGFQQKSLKKILSSIKQGRTVLFVSHNMAAVKQMCTKGILLSDGQIHAAGDINTVTNEYTSTSMAPVVEHFDETATSVRVSKDMYETFDPRLKFGTIRITNEKLKPGIEIHYQEDIEFSIELEATEPLKNARVGLAIQTMEGVIVAIVHSDDNGQNKKLNLSPGKYKFKVNLHNGFRPGKYLIGFGAHEAIKGGASIYAPSLLAIDVLNVDKNNKKAPIQDGFVTFPSQWELK